MFCVLLGFTLSLNAANHRLKTHKIGSAAKHIATVVHLWCHQPRACVQTQGINPRGIMRRKELHNIMEKIDQVRETDIDDIPENSRFLLEMVRKSHEVKHPQQDVLGGCNGGSNQGRPKEDKSWRQEQDPDKAPPTKINKREASNY